jgi:hypothetical protein
LSYLGIKVSWGCFCHPDAVKNEETKGFQCLLEISNCSRLLQGKDLSQAEELATIQTVMLRMLGYTYFLCKLASLSRHYQGKLHYGWQ